MKLLRAKKLAENWKHSASIQVRWKGWCTRLNNWKNGDILSRFLQLPEGQSRRWRVKSQSASAVVNHFKSSAWKMLKSVYIIGARHCIHGREVGVRVNPWPYPEHWLVGERTRVYTCCSRPADTGEGCSQGPHVFYESDIDILHSRHPFSTVPASSPKALDVVALDCEMVYSTGGMRVARVSVVDGAGKLVLDELIKMDDGVHVMYVVPQVSGCHYSLKVPFSDYNTRFSGIDSENYAKATKDLASVRESLHRFIDSHTIIIGHALENDLKTLRIVHHRCVDTALLFPHKSGPPYRRSLKDLYVKASSHQYDIA